MFCFINKILLLSLLIITRDSQKKKITTKHIKKTKLYI